MKPKIVFKLTVKVPGNKLLVDFLFGTREELESFLNLNKLQPFEVRMVITDAKKTYTNF
jgi:IS1 family transposase